MAVDISQVNPFPRVYRLFQYYVDHEQYAADLMTGSNLGEFVQYTGNLDFLTSSYLRPGEAYLLRDKESRERYTIGCEKTEGTERFVFTLLRPDVDIEAWLEKTSPYFLPDNDPSRLQLSWLVREGLKQSGVLHYHEGLYKVTFPEEVEEARVSLAPGKEPVFHKNTASAGDWASKLEHFVQ